MSVPAAFKHNSEVLLRGQVTVICCLISASVWYPLKFPATNVPLVLINISGTTFFIFRAPTVQIDGFLLIKNKVVWKDLRAWKKQSGGRSSAPTCSSSESV